MKFKIRIAIAALVPAAALALALSASGAPAKVAAPAKASFNSAGCYPGNEFTVDDDFGAFSAKSSGTASDGTGSVSWAFTQKIVGNKGSVDYSHTPGGMDGSLTATFHLTAVAHPVVFTSHCLQEAVLYYTGMSGTGTAGTGYGNATTVAEFEGVLDLPPWQGGDAHAVVSLNLDATSLCMMPCQGTGGNAPLTTADVNLEHGSTCHELSKGQYGYDIFDESPVATLNAAFHKKGDEYDRSRAGLPNGVTPGKNPCDGVTLDPDPVTW